MEVTRTTLDADSSGYAVEHDGETYSFEVLGSSAVRFVDDHRLPPEVAAEMQSLGFATVEVTEDFHVRMDDPDDAHVGMRWYRSDRGAVRSQMADGSIEERTIFDVPETQIIEDFEGASIGDFDTVTTLGNPQYDIMDRTGDDWFAMTADPSDLGGLALDVGEDIVEVGVDMELTDGDVAGIFGISPAQTPSDGYVFALHTQELGIAEIYQIPEGGSSGTLIDNITVNDPAEFEEPFFSYLSIEGDSVSLQIETSAGGYSVSGTLPSPDISGGQYVPLGNSQVQDDAGTIYFNDVRQIVDQGQLSRAIPHGELADAPPAAHHTRPSAGAGIQDNSDTFRAKYPVEDLSQRTGDYDMEPACDDGTNTPARGTLCLWDASNSVWRPQNNPDGGAF
jgi:hypothetical protein